jgi:hypothetical protein
VRPGRIAVLVDSRDPHWVHTSLRILEYFATLWGGYGNIIVPTDGTRIDPLLWSILEKFDPDYLYFYRPTLRDLELRDRPAFEAIVERHVARWKEQVGSAEQYAIDEIRENLQTSLIGDFVISHELQEQLKGRLSPFFFKDFVVQAGWLTAGSAGHYPQTDITDILPNTDHPERIVTTSPTLEAFDRLWCASHIGICSERSAQKFNDIHVNVLQVGGERSSEHFDEHMGQVFSFAMSQGSGFSLPSAPLGDGSPAVTAPTRDTVANLSLLNLGQYRSTRLFSYNLKTIAVAGREFADFCLYFALSRMRERVFWVLPSIIDLALDESNVPFRRSPEHQFVWALQSSSRHRNDYADGLDLITASLDGEKLEGVGAAMKNLAISDFASSRPSSPFEVIPEHPFRYYEKKGAFERRTMQVSESGIVELFDTPKPKTFSYVNAHSHRWIAEVVSPSFQLPRHPALGYWLSGGAGGTTGEARMSSTGLAYFCPNVMIFGGQDLDAILVRPNIRVPEANEIFTFLATSAGLKSTISDKGSYAQDTIGKLGGLENARIFLRSAAGKLLVAAYLSQAPPDGGRNDQGVLLNSRRYLDFAAISGALGSDDSARGYIDDFARRRILYRGFIFRCQFCRNTAWYPVGELSDFFTCLRCHRQQIYTSDHWKSGSSPSWYYQLDEVLYQGLAHDCHVPILALDRSRRTSRDSFLFVDELEYWKPELQKPFIECDLNCVQDGVLTLGEAKKGNRLSPTRKAEAETLQRYKELSVLLGARRVIFATEADQWDAGTVKQIFGAFRSTWAEVVLMGGSDLYS